MADIAHTLVDPDWLEARLNDPKVRIIALNWAGSKDFDAGHIPGAIYWDWKDMLWDPLIRDFPNAETFALRCAAAGITNDTTVVFYGDPAVQFGTYGWWVFKYCGHKDARVLNGARMRWEREGRPMTAEGAKIEATHYTPNSTSGSVRMRAMRNDVLAAIDREDTVILDHRSSEEYHGELLSPPGSPNHGAERLGHIPGAKHLYFEDFLEEDHSFKPVEEIRNMLQRRGATPDKNIISYCRLSHRATLAYFAMTQLLGYMNVRSYDGSWTEWGSVVGVPIER
jgi:thiosulfate/3-mercaptopyruvate sulfurtransferase